MLITVVVHISQNHQEIVTLPDDIALSRLAPALAKKLDLPFAEQGQVIEYTLWRKNPQTKIHPELTLAEADIKEKENLVLQRTGKNTAHVGLPVTINRKESLQKVTLKKKRIFTPTIIMISVVMLFSFYFWPLLFISPVYDQLVSNGADSFFATNTTSPLDSGIKPEMVWQFPVEDAIATVPVVDNGTVYFGVSDDANPNFYALDVVTGEQLWQFTADGSVTSTPALTDEMVFFGTQNDYFYALDRTNGGELWRFVPDQRRLDCGCGYLQHHSYPVVADSVVYVGNLDHNFYALDAVTGVELWRVNAGSRVEDKPAVLDGVVYFGTEESVFYAIDAENGTEIYRTQIVRRPSRSRISCQMDEGDTLQISTGDSVITYTVNGERGTRTCRSTVVNGDSLSAPFVEEDTIYITSGDIVALDRETGTRLWRFGNGDGIHTRIHDDVHDIWSRPLADNQHVYVVGGNTIYALDKNNGDIIWKYANSSGELVLDNGIIYFGDSNSRLVAINAESGERLIIYNLGKLQSYLDDAWPGTVSTPLIESGIAYVGWENQMNAIQLETP